MLFILKNQKSCFFIVGLWSEKQSGACRTSQMLLTPPQETRIHTAGTGLGPQPDRQVPLFPGQVVPLFVRRPKENPIEVKFLQIELIPSPKISARRNVYRIH